MLLTVICTIISSMTMITCVFLTARYTKYQKKAMQQAEQRAGEGALMLNMIHAIGKVAIGTALAIKNNKINGELDEALIEVEKADKDYLVFIEKVAMESLRK